MTQNWAIKPLVPEEVYTDRQEFLDYLYQAALKAKTRRTGSTVLLGQRRMGKTEIFKRVVNRLFFEQDHHDPKAVVPVYYSFPDTFEDRWDFSLKYVENFIRWYIAFRLREPNIVQERLDREKMLVIIREKISLTKGLQMSLNFLDSLVKKTITIPEQEALFHPRCVSDYDDNTIVMFLDEFQNTRLPQHHFDVVGYMQEAGESPTCPHFVTGSSMSILAREILGRGSLFGRFRTKPIEPLTGYWGTQLVQKAATYHQVTVSQELAPIIAQRCGGNPFYMNAIVQQSAEMNQSLLTEENLNKILAVDLSSSSGFIWGELSEQVNRWIERINEHGITKWILYLAAIQPDHKDDEIFPEQIQTALLEREGKKVSIEKIQEVLIKLSRGDLLEYMELGGWFCKVQDPILLEFLKVWGRIEIERQNQGQVREELRLKYETLERRIYDLKGYLAEVYMVQIIFNAQRKKLPGCYFHQKIDIEIPDFSYINQRERIASGADSQIDIHGGAGIEQWVAESRWLHDRKVGIKEIQKLIDKGEWVKNKIGADFTRVWFFSHDGFTQEAEKFMEKQSVLWSTRADLDGLLDYVKLRRLPKL